MRDARTPRRLPYTKDIVQGALEAVPGILKRLDRAEQGTASLHDLAGRGAELLDRDELPTVKREVLQQRSAPSAVIPAAVPQEPPTAVTGHEALDGVDHVLCRTR